MSLYLIKHFQEKANSLIKRVCKVSVDTVKIVNEMEGKNK